VGGDGVAGVLLEVLELFLVVAYDHSFGFLFVQM